MSDSGDSMIFGGSISGNCMNSSTLGLVLLALALVGCERQIADSPLAFGREQLAALRALDGAKLAGLRFSDAQRMQWEDSYARMLKSGELDAATFDRSLETLRRLAASGPSDAFERELAALQPDLKKMLAAIEANLATSFDQDPYLSREQREAAKIQVSVLLKRLDNAVLLNPERLKSLAQAWLGALNARGVRRYADLSTAGDDALSARMALGLELMHLTLKGIDVDARAALDASSIAVVSSSATSALIATVVPLDGQELRFTERLTKRSERWYPARLSED